MSDLKQMELLKCLYKAQVELGNAYQCCEDKMMKADLWEEYTQLDLTISIIEDRLELFKEN